MAPYLDMYTGFRLIRRDLAEEIAPDVKHLSFFTAEFVVRAHYAGYKILEVPVHHYARKIGSTTIFYVSKLFFICIAQFLGILRMRVEFEESRLMQRRPSSYWLFSLRRLWHWYHKPSHMR